MCWGAVPFWCAPYPFKATHKRIARRDSPTKRCLPYPRRFVRGGSLLIRRRMKRSLMGMVYNSRERFDEGSKVSGTHVNRGLRVVP